MAMTQRPEPDGTRPLIIGGSILVAITTPLNLILLLLCWWLVKATAGPYSADNNGPLIGLFAGAINVGLFVLLCGVAIVVFWRSSAYARRVAILVVLVLHLGLWIGLSFALLASMGASGIWL